MRLLSITILFIVASALHAEPVKESSSRSFFLTLSAGPAWYARGYSQTLYLQPEVANTYLADSETRGLVSGELFFGLEKSFLPHLISQLGIALAMNERAKLTGGIWETADSAFDNFEDQYHLIHNHIAVKGQLFWENPNAFASPYVNGSIGIGFNSSYDFTATPTIFEAVPPPLFQDHQQTAFTYTLGLGLQKTLSPFWRGALGYQFSDWGKSGLARAPGQTLNQGLQENHFYTHELVISMSYRFGAF